uniref:Uncharacterized protein n=1 Tax=Brugia malayi TaxID=6279 RepID=A0A5S6P9X2_BRUMA
MTNESQSRSDKCEKYYILGSCENPKNCSS